MKTMITIIMAEDHQMLIDGVFIKQDAFRTLCIIEELSDALKKLIREELAAVMHGSNEVLELPEYHTYHNTLGFFLDRYEKKSQNIKKNNCFCISEQKTQTLTVLDI